MKKNLAGWIGMLSTLTALSSSLAHAEAWGEKDKLQDFVSRMDVMVNADEIDQANLHTAKLDNRPWSSTFWPDLLGSVAWRYTVYATSPINNGVDMAVWGWPHSRAKIMQDGYVMQANGKHIDVMKMSQDALDRLSPAEKYDVLMGDANFTFWNKIIARVDQLHQVNLLSTWSGVCHGWSPASLTMDRPLHGIKLMSPLGREVTFYPDDIKALAAYLWGTGFGSEGNPQNFVKIEGAKCQTGAKSNKHGRVTDPRCADVNPGFFHLAMVNQIGRNHRGFVMDRSRKAEIQNQPTFEYKFSYFNVQQGSHHAGLSLAKAKVSLKNNPDFYDDFYNYRSRKAVAVVGVLAEIKYGKENYNPNHQWTDSPEHDATDVLKIKYDLELDEKNDIIGGEWREYEDASAPSLFEQFSYQHPNLMWLAPHGLKATSPGDFDIKTAWDGTGPVPADWTAAALKSSNKHYADSVRGTPIDRLSPQPLAHVVELLIAKSRE